MFIDEENRAESLDEDVLMPEGYEPGQDIFAPEPEDNPTTDETGIEADGAEQGEPTLEDYASSLEEQEGAADEQNPPQTEEDEPSTEEPSAEVNPTIDTPKPTVKVRFNHEDLELSPEDAASYAQKGMNYDKILERLQQAEAKNATADEVARVLGYDSADALFKETRESIREQRVQKYVNDDGVPEPLARYLVEQEISKEEKAAKDFVAQAQKPIEEPQPTPNPVGQRKQLVSDADMTAFVKAHPGVTKLPDEVVQAVMSGVNISVAYAEYESKKNKEEIRILKQNQAAAEKAPVSGVTKNGGVNTKTKKDPFAAGFDGDDW